MRIGIDIDGVLADFVKGYNALAKAEFGVDLPNPAPCWNWGRAGGLDREQEGKLWDYIKTSMFWGTLLPLPGAIDALERLNTLSIGGHDIYFITSRPGKLAKYLTEMWLKFHGYDTPTVLLAAHDKGPLAVGLQLDVFVDDKPENNQNVLDELEENAIDARVYLTDALYNQWALQPDYGIRVANLNEVLEREFPQSERRAA